MPTLIQITDEQWKVLNNMKLKGESFSDIIERLIISFYNKKLQEVKTNGNIE